MGRNRKYPDDVCRINFSIYRQKKPGQLDDVGNTSNLLVFYTNHIGKQRNSSAGVAKIETERNDCLPKMVGDHISVVSSFFSVASSRIYEIW